MDFSPIELPPDVQQFWMNDVCAFYDEHLSAEILATERRGGNGYLPELDRALAERGWLDPMAPVEDGGAALDGLRAAVIAAEELRRAGVFPVKGSHHLVMAVLDQFASDELAAELTVGVRSGETHFCLGYTEPDCGSDAAAITTRAVRDGDEWIVTGQKMFSTGAHMCQYVMMTARTNPDVSKHKGITMFLVPLDLEGIETQGIGTLGGERTNFIYFDGARVSDRYRLGPVDHGWKVASGALAAEHGLDAEHGAMKPRTRVDLELVDALAGETGWARILDQALAAAVEWARVSRRPDGTHPIDDPLVRVRLARIELDCELRAATPSPYVRVMSADAMIRDTADLMDLTGAAGLLSTEDPQCVGDGIIEYAHRFAQATSTYGGTNEIHRNLIAEQFLGLPRHRGAIRS